jgi:hypothetical protein
LKEYRPRLNQDEYNLILNHRGKLEVPVVKKAHILLLDIETAPILAYVWSLWKPTIAHMQIDRDWFIISWRAKWLLEEEIFGDVLTPNEAVEQNDKRIIKSIWEMINEADIVIAHNGNKFDLPKLNTRFVYHGLEPPMSYQSIDTLAVAKRHFKFTSNRLDYLGDFLGVGRKIPTDWTLWEKCYFGDIEALEHMYEYNEQDVLLLEDVYIKLRPYIKSHPNLGVFSDEIVSQCPNCGSTKLNWGGTPYTTGVGRYTSFRCLDCGAVGHSRISELDKYKRKELVTSCAR